MKAVLPLMAFLWFTCNRENSYVKMTDEYLEVHIDPSATAIYEVDVLKFDSSLHYPTEEILVSLYWIIDRKTLKPPTEKSFVKVYFAEHNEKYVWKVMKDPTLAEYANQDTLI